MKGPVQSRTGPFLPEQEFLEFVGESIYNFHSVGLTREAKKVLARFHNEVLEVITKGVEKSVAISDKKNVALFHKVAKTRKGLEETNVTEILRKNVLRGQTLSNRVWRLTDTLKEQIELTLDLGFREGRSAAAISKDLRMYLQEPDRLYRRVKDVHGELKLSKAASSYKPGAGVYRSSYQNAMRLARTSINRAYHMADANRWQQLDFVVGVRVSRTASPTDCPLCDSLEGDYPKYFVFPGWHPDCLCHATPILANTDLGDEEKATNVVKTPEKFNKWVDENAERLKEAQERGTTPWFILDNERYFKVL